ncbi:MAG: hypothetical protein KME47_09675 [Nodosilinea sp. WJT8-NPBG4]|jgi:hypothetical protein|nr:hypothetical protein [Nodosilinea sp. WJT8-NPBG4]
MATPQLITRTNQTTLLVQSTQGRAGTPDGNIFIDTVNDRIEIITAEELSQVNLGSGLEANPLTNAFGITLQALYAFERRIRRTNTSLRKFLPGTDGVFQFAGAWVFENGIKLAGTDRTKIRQSGWIEYSATRAIDRIYFGVRSLNDIQPTSQPYIQLSASQSEVDLLAAAPINASRLGPLDEAFQVFGSTANGDSGAGNFDFTTSRVLFSKVRTFGYTQGVAFSKGVGGSGVETLQGFSAGFGLGEVLSPTSTFTLSQVYGGSAISPYTGILFTRFASPQTKTGFVQASGLFTDVISNSAGATLAQIRARMDAWMQLDTDIDTNLNGFKPKRAARLYTIDDVGRLRPRQGLFIENVPTADQQSVAFTDNSGNLKTYPFNVQVTVFVSDAWANDPNAWYQCMFKDGASTADFDTTGAVIVNNASGVPVVGTSSAATGSTGSKRIVFSFDYDGNVQAGLVAGIDKVVVFLAEGDGGAQAALAEITITRQSTISAQALSEAETNI